MDPVIAIAKARLWALNTAHVVFYGALACNLKDVIDPSVRTACTNGKVIRWNPSFVEGLTNEEVRFVLLHETLHCAFGHFWRLPLNADGNKAGDYVINWGLRNVAGIAAPKGALLDPRFDGMAEEEVLAALDKEKPEPDDGDDEGDDQPEGDEQGDGEPQGGDAGETDDGGCGGFEAPAPDAPKPDGDGDGDGNGKPTAEPETLRERWERNVVQADQVARAAKAGNAPADLQRIIDRVTAPTRIDWKAACADFLKSNIATRADYVRGSRRMESGHGKPVYPRRRVDSTAMVVFVRDTSGSIDGKLMADFTALIAQSTGDLQCEALVIDADAMVQAEYRLAAGEEAPATGAGGGGTDFRPAFARVAELLEQGENVAGVVYLTDLYGTEPDEVPTPTLWVSVTKGATARTGNTVFAEL